MPHSARHYARITSYNVCYTKLLRGRESCFFQRLQDDRWVAVEPALKSPEEIYGKR